MSRKKVPSPRRLFLLTLTTLFLIELSVMLLFRALPELPKLTEAFLDAFLLSFLFVPFLYLFILRPYREHIRLKSKAETERHKIEEINRIKSEIISVAAHELRTPLAVIVGYSELLQARVGSEAEQQEYIATILGKTEVMERLIDDLMDLTRIEQGLPLNIAPEPGDIVAPIAALVAGYRTRNPHRHFEVALPASPVMVHFDRIRLEQVLDNLLANALRFSAAGSGISISAHTDGQWFRVAIADQGVGMTPEQVQQIFDKFYRADTSDTSAAGLGLGLTIVKYIIEAHQGEIRVHSSPGVGTEVIFSLPLPGHLDPLAEKDVA